jgi:hypothetical protein
MKSILTIILLILSVSAISQNRYEQEFKEADMAFTLITKQNIMKKTGIELIAQERKEQIEKHGFTIEVDSEKQKDFQLSGVATLLCIPDFKDVGLDDDDIEEYRPFNWSEEMFNKLHKKPYVERLVIAGALIAAEIDRLNQ